MLQIAGKPAEARIILEYHSQLTSGVTRRFFRSNGAFRWWRQRAAYECPQPSALSTEAFRGMTSYIVLLAQVVVCEVVNIGGMIMRFKSKKVGGFQVFAVSGTNTVSFGIDFDRSTVDGLLGFAIEREDTVENERYFMYGFKVFESIYPNPDKDLQVSTFSQPVQSFVWDDFTAKDGRTYTYYFHPLKGTPKNLDRSAKAIPITVTTEKLFTNGTHDIFFNRGVASSQAYARKFKNKAPDALTEPDRTRALEWLSRSLDEAILAFIDNAEAGDTLLGAFYEFRYLPVAERLKAAIDRGVSVKLVIDAKKNGYTDKKGKVHPDFPREDNLNTVKDARLPESAIECWREHNPDAIAHNKFMVLLKGGAPAEVWTGSTNLSAGGIHGQTNVGHWLRDPATADHFKAYWQLLATDPGKTGDEDAAGARKLMAACRKSVGNLLATPTDWKAIPSGTTPVFSPRAGGEVLSMYAAALDESSTLGCITLAFGISALFKDKLVLNDGKGPLTFLMLEKKDEARKGARTPFVRLGAHNNVYAAWGSYIEDPLYRWTRESNARALGLNLHVSYIHSKFLLHDPLGADPIVVTGSANFSTASTNDNDENMLLIRGERRVADIYFTEFNRLFFHYYFRSVHEEAHDRAEAGTAAANAAADQKASLFLDETDGWLTKYKPGSLRTKRVAMFTKMEGTVTS
ncbi:phospholipase D-like domain-containing protein [Rhizobium sp. L43]|uniref:phospholipase D-like domain-containing protein n=1 Tax=Rhizobium sp. L43 TaxID=2035452 RepID=UPI0015CF5C5A|nr:phospholipase D-like domain-containing protein [Rhizobium sp. L43]